TRAVPVDLEAGTGAEGHVAVLVEVVAVGGRAGGLEEDLVVAAGEHRIEVAGVGLCGDLDKRRAGLPRAPETARDVPHLRLDQVEVRRAVERVGADASCSAPSTVRRPLGMIASMLV